MPPNLARGRRYLDAVTAGGAIVLSASQLGVTSPGGDVWGVTVGVLETVVIWLTLCALMYRGSAWPRRFVAGLCWFLAGFCVFVFMMAGGPLMFTASATARAQGAAVVAAFCGYLTVALLSGSAHIRAFVVAQREARRSGARTEP